MLIELTCKYCNKKWERNVYVRSSISTERCTRCGDRNLTARDLKETKIDYYEGAPPFQKDEPENPPNPYYDDFGDHD